MPSHPNVEKTFNPAALHKVSSSAHVHRTSTRAGSWTWSSPKDCDSEEELSGSVPSSPTRSRLSEKAQLMTIRSKINDSENTPSHTTSWTEERLKSTATQVFTDSDLSPQTIFRFCAPIFVFACLLLAAVLLPRNQRLCSWLADAQDGNFMRLFLVALSMLLGVVGGALAVLWGSIWLVSACVDMILSVEWQGRNKETPGALELVLGGGLFS